jgi:phage terminase large subunit-like protein
MLRHVTGEWASAADSRIKLEDWQVFDEYNLFGWVSTTTGLRRFRRTYEEVARKNAKSTRLAGRMLYLTFADGEPGAYTYSGATTEDQAREVFSVASKMATQDPEFMERFGVVVLKNAISQVQTGSAFRLLTGKATTKDGLNVHGACLDEVHAHKTRELYDVIDSADGARRQPLVSCITTAGFNTSGIGYQLRDYTLKVLAGVLQDEAWWGTIYTIDQDDDWTDPEVWGKANPNLGVSVKRKQLEDSCIRAQASASLRDNFKTKHLNVWVSGGASWMDMPAWAKCADERTTLADMAGQKCWIGMDLALKQDFAALCLVFAEGDRYRIVPRLYYNAAAVQASPVAQLSGWVADGHVVVNEGNVTDFDAIAHDLRTYCAMFDVQEIAYDRALSNYFAQKLVDEGLPLVEIRQNPVFYTQPLVQVQNLVREQKIAHDGNPVMAWMMANVQVRTSQFNGLSMPIKSADQNKIDGPVAMLMALGRAMYGVQLGSNINDFLDDPVSVAV